MTIETMRKDKILLRKNDPIRATVYTMLLDAISKIAKSDGNREPIDSDIVVAAKQQANSYKSAIALLSERGADCIQEKQEYAIIEEFLPKLLDEASCRTEIKKIVESFPEEDRTKKNIGKIMAKLKTIKDIDMSISSKIVNEFLS